MADPHQNPAKPTPVKQAPNVKFIGTRKINGEAQRLTEAPRAVRDGFTVYELPDSKTQLAGFYHEKAAELCRAFPGLYKQITPRK